MFHVPYLCAGWTYQKSVQNLSKICPKHLSSPVLSVHLYWTERYMGVTKTLIQILFIFDSNVSISRIPICHPWSRLPPLLRYSWDTYIVIPLITPLTSSSPAGHSILTKSDHLFEKGIHQLFFYPLPCPMKVDKNMDSASLAILI